MLDNLATYNTRLLDGVDRMVDALRRFSFVPITGALRVAMEPLRRTVDVVDSDDYDHLEDLVPVLQGTA